MSEIIDLLKPHYNHYSSKRKSLYPIIVQVGVGGTGSNFSQQLAQMISVFGMNAYYLLVDPDYIEKKNVRNQLFTEGTVGKKKAEILAKRYSAAYGINVHSYTESYLESSEQLLSLFNSDYIDIPNYHDTRVLPILIGCVDNNYSRKVFHEFFEKVPTLLYLDSGNESVRIPSDYQTRPQSKWSEDEVKAYNESGWSGQVICGLKLQGHTVLEPFATRQPDIWEDNDEIKPSELSCQDLAASDPQRLLTNRMASMALATYVTELFECGTISNSKTTFHAKKGFMLSEPVSAVDPKYLA